jgi:hypothetical protein
MSEQSMQHHTRWLPPFHFFVLPVLLINFGSSIYWCVREGIRYKSVLSVLVAAALLTGFLMARMMAIRVQDRLIPLEERLRLERLLAADLRKRIEEFTIEQLVALRFASDAEIPELACRVLDGKLNDRKAIKQLIKTWRPDFVRA